MLLKMCHATSAVSSAFSNISRTFHHTATKYHFLKKRAIAIQKAFALYLYISSVKKEIFCASVVQVAGPLYLWLHLHLAGSLICSVDNMDF